MRIITQVSQAMQRVLTIAATEAAKETGFIQRQVKVTGANFCQTLVFGWLQEPEATLESLCQTGMAVGLDITPQGLDQRFTKAASDCLYQVLQAALSETIQTKAVALPVLQRFNGVYIEDSSSITLPEELASVWSGCGGSSSASNGAVKLQVRWDMLHGGLDGPYLSNGRTHDRVAATLNQPLPEGSLLIRDLGYWKLGALEDLNKAGCFWLSRAQAQTGFVDSSGQPWSQATYVQQQTEDVFDIPVELGLEKRLKARLVGFRVPPAVAQQRRRKLKEASKRKGQTVSADRLVLCDWALFVTNVPIEQLAPAEMIVLARLRWQIELLFKLWKSQGGIDKSRSDKPWRILCELYAKLIGMIIQHWSFLLGNWQFPD
ncbi:MAG: IS4 family transposase, partial [Anaerolineae bacterium]